MTPQSFTPDEIQRAEHLVSRIHGVSSCQITSNELGEIAEVHVVATVDKPPKLIARDVESCLKAEMGMSVDYKKIGVVIFDSATGTAEPGPDEQVDKPSVSPSHLEPIVEFPIQEHAARFTFQSVNLFVSQGGVKAEVELTRDGAETFGTASHNNPTLPPWPLVAEATLAAISESLDESTRLCLGEVRRISLADAHTFVVRVDLIENRDKKCLAGCSIITGNEAQAVVYAALDAVNRVVGKLEFKTSVEYKIR